MWRTKQIGNGEFCCENTKTWDTTDTTWGTEAEAAAWAASSNEANANQIAENKRRAAERRTANAGKVTAADMLIDRNAH